MTGHDAASAPLAGARTRTLRQAEPAKVIGWLLLAGWGGFSLVAYLGNGQPVSLVFGLLCLGLLAGFVQAHRHEGTTFSRAWFGFFTGTIAVLGLAVKALTLVT